MIDLKNEPSLPALALTMLYWQGSTTFGRPAVEQVLGHTDNPSPLRKMLGRDRSPWQDRYPEVIAGLQSTDMRTKYDTIVPPEIVYEIAGRRECYNNFYIDPDGRRL